MEEIVVLECTYSPSDYFEETIEIRGEGYKAVVAEGKVTTHVRPDIYAANPGFREEVEESINAHFLGAQLVTQKPFMLSKISTASHFHADGRKDVAVFVQPAVAIAIGCTVDFVHKDRDGNVKYDSRKARVEKKKALGELTAKYYRSDPVARSVLNSSKAAADDPDHSLVHLYEIRDALAKRFRGESAACNSLGISVEGWERLGKLANSEPLKEGRHRGKFISGLRNATKSEVTEAWTIACELIEEYLRYLERQTVTLP